MEVVFDTGGSAKIEGCFAGRSEKRRSASQEPEAERVDRVETEHAASLAVGPPTGCADRDLEASREVEGQDTETLPGTVRRVAAGGDGIESEAVLQFAVGLLMRASAVEEVPQGSRGCGIGTCFCQLWPRSASPGCLGFVARPDCFLKRDSSRGRAAPVGPVPLWPVLRAASGPGLGAPGPGNSARGGRGWRAGRLRLSDPGARVPGAGRERAAQASGPRASGPGADGSS